MIDFGRAIYYRQVMINLAREGSNEAARGSGSSTADVITNAVNAVFASASPKPLQAASLRIIISSVTRAGTTFTVTAQVPKGGYAVNSRFRTGPGQFTLSKWPNTSTAIPQPNRTAYTTEVFYQYTPATPLGKLLKWALPTQLYDVAYFM